MGSRSETTLSVLAAAVAGQLVGRATAEFVQLVTAIGLTITPLLARIGHDIARRIEMRSGDAQTEETPEGRTVIVGFGRVGHTVAELLREHDRRSEEHTSELQSLMRISYAVLCLKKKQKNQLQLQS